MSHDDRPIIPKQGWLKVRLHSQSKWHRRYCTIDWDKAILLLATKVDGRARDWIKLLPNIAINGDGQDIEIREETNLALGQGDTHLFQAENKGEHDAWLIALKRTAYSRVGGGIFGQTLEETYRYSLEKTSLVPFIVRQCCEYLLKYGSTFVGLFRIPGKQSTIKELRDRYDRGLPVELDSSISPATICSLLKSYLQSLPEPIIPVHSFDEFLEIGSRLKYNPSNELDRLKQLIETHLRQINYALLAYLCVFLKKLTEHQHRTKMDTENLAVTFGNNLIRSSEELDLNMIKGHNYNLVPLIKVLIDQSDYLFSASIEEKTPSDQHNESLTKSSGFSSVSSLLSSQDQPVLVRLRSSSMPSIRLPTCRSFDSANLSYESPLDQDSFITCMERDFPTDPEKDPTSDIKCDDNYQLAMTSPLYSSLRKPVPAKKTFVKQFGKSLISFKSSMSKAFHPSSSSSTENIPQCRTATETRRVSSTEEFNSLEDCLKTIQHQIEILTDLIDEKESLIVTLTKTCYDQRQKYQRETCELTQIIEQLQMENSQLKSRSLSLL